MLVRDGTVTLIIHVPVCICVFRWLNRDWTKAEFDNEARTHDVMRRFGTAHLCQCFASASL